MKAKPAFVAFAEKIEVTASGCWRWTGAVHRHHTHPRGVFGRFPNRWLAHRFAWWHFRGSLAGEVDIVQRCRTRLCVNPWCHDLVPVGRSRMARQAAAGIGSPSERGEPREVLLRD